MYIGRGGRLTWFGIHLRLPKYDAASAGNISAPVRRTDCPVFDQNADVLRASIEASYVKLLFSRDARPAFLQTHHYLAADPVLRRANLRLPS